MHRFRSPLRGVACALALLLPVQALDAQLARMRADFDARRYAAVIAAANARLESPLPIHVAERLALWELLAAAYYPETPAAQQPDSARLPLEALIRFVPDFSIAPALSWPGLDALTDRVRAQSFSVVTRPAQEYTLGGDERAAIGAVASRPTRFTLTSVDSATGRRVRHDSSDYVMMASLQLRGRDASGPIFSDGSYRLEVWAFDQLSGDSLRITHRVVATRRELPALVEEPAPPATELTTQPLAAPAARRYSRPALWGGLALAVATAVIAQEARPRDALRSEYRVDGRAFVASAVMVGAAFANRFIGRSRPVRVSRPSSAPPRSVPALERYRVVLLVSPAEP